MRTLSLVICTSTFIVTVLHGKEKGDTASYAVQREYERSVELASEETDVSPYVDALSDLYDDPLDLNYATATELMQLPNLDPMVARRIVSRRSTKLFEKVSDLSDVEGMTPEVLRSMNPFVKVKQRSAYPGGTRLLHIRTRAARSLMPQSESGTESTLGTPEKIYSKIVVRISGEGQFDGRGVTQPEYEAPSLLIGLLTEKDPGEKSYADFTTGHLYATLPSLSTRVVLGDFVVESGQGLVFWKPGGLSKGSEATAKVARSGSGIRPSFSSDQSWFFRGAALDCSIGSFNLAAFSSSKSIDADVDSFGVVRRLDVTGLHTTNAQLEKKNQLKERAVGAKIGLHAADGLEIGASVYRSVFSKRVILSGPFGFDGTENSGVGIDASYIQSDLSVFGEVAQDYKRIRAGVFGTLLKLHRTASMAILLRSYPVGFRTFHGSGFSENGAGVKNESGVYCGLTYRPLDWITISSYFDQFTFPWRTGNASLPSAGNEMLASAEVSPEKRLNLELRFRQRQKPAESVAGDPYGLSQRQDEMRLQRNIRLTLTVGSSGSLIWKSRLEATTVHYSMRQIRESGLLAFQDFSFAPIPKASLVIRAIAYATESYDSRLYEFEEEVPGTYRNPALYGKGLRWYLVGRLEYNHYVELSAKYSQTSSDGPTRSVAGRWATGGVIDSQLTLQMDVKW